MELEEKIFYTTGEAAEILNVSVATVQKWSRDGVLEFWNTVGGHRRITRNSLEKMIATRIPRTNSCV